jgi:hypothetical protein
VCAPREGIGCSDGVQARGIPAYKLAGVDGWVVVPGEIDEALNIIEQTDAAPDDPTWKEWIDFLKAARGAGGFIVE